MDRATDPGLTIAVNQVGHYELIPLRVIIADIRGSMAR
jgi:hypothetical protein